MHLSILVRLKRSVMLRYLVALYLFLFLIPILYAQNSEDHRTDSLKTILIQKHLPDSVRLNVLIQLANEYSWSKPDSAMAYITSAMKMDSSLRDPDKETTLKILLGYHQMMKGKYVDAIRFFENALALCKRSPNRSLEAEAYSSIGGSYEFLGNYKLSLQNHENSLKLHSELNDKKNIARDYSNLGQVYKRLGNWPVSLSFYFKSLALREQLKNTRGIAYCLMNMGEVYQLMKNYNESLRYLQRAMSVGSGHLSKRNMADISQHLCKIFYLMDKMDSALFYQQQALQLYEDLDETIGIAINHSHLAFIQIKKNNVRESLKHCQYALKLQRKIGDKAGSATSLCLIADIYDTLRQYALAGKFAMQALELSDSAGLLQHKSDALERIINAFHNQGNFERSFHFQKMLQTVRDSLLSEERTRQIANMEALYEKDSKEREILALQQQSLIQRLELGQQTFWKKTVTIGLVFALLFLLVLYNRFRVKKRSIKLLAQRNAIIAQKEIDLNNSLREKEVLLKEMHHRVKNNLQIISSLFNLQSRATKDERVIAVMKEGQARVKSMALIHQKLYAEEELSSISFQDYTRELLDYLFKTYQHPHKNISYQLNSFDLKLDVDTAIPLGLIMNELISNSLKYAFLDMTEGIIRVSVIPTEEPGRLRLMVGDNGRGMPENFDYERASSIGLRLVRSLSTQLQADLTMLNSGGVSYSIDFRLN